MGVTKEGRVAVLTNFREESYVSANDLKSRGAIVSMFLTAPPDDVKDDYTTKFAKWMVEEEGVQDFGGFSLLYGNLKDVIRNVTKERNEKGEPTKEKARGLAVISNRTEDSNAIIRIASDLDEIYGLSNTHFSDETWPKVINGRNELLKTVQEHAAAGEGKQELLDRLFAVLRIDTLPPRVDNEELQEYFKQLRNSIYVPVVNGKVEDKDGDWAHGTYGTKQQTIILADKNGNITYLERTLYGNDGLKVDDGDRDKLFEFQIEGFGN